MTFPKAGSTREFSILRTFRRVTLVVILAVGISSFGGSTVLAAPSVVDQYTEQVPSPGGDKKSGDLTEPGGGSDGTASPAGSSTSGPGSSSLPQSTDGGTPETSGSSGPAAARSGATSGGSQRSPSNTESNDSKSAVASVVDGLKNDDDAGMGALFPLVLIASVVLVCGAYLVRRQRARTGGHDVS